MASAPSEAVRVARRVVCGVSTSRCLPERARSRCECDDPHVLPGDSPKLRRFDRGRIPSIAEAEHTGVDILGRTDATGNRVRDEEAGRTAADEDEVVEYGAKQADDGLEERAIRVRDAVTP